MHNNPLQPRAFKTAWFAKTSKKALITDAELAQSVREALLGQVDDLGGGVYKKRIKDNRYRALILTKGMCEGLRAADAQAPSNFDRQPRPA